MGVGKNFGNFRFHFIPPAQPAVTCSKLTIKTLVQGVEYVQS